MPTDRERLEALARYPTKLCTYEDGAAIQRTLDVLDEMARVVQGLGVLTDEIVRSLQPPMSGVELTDKVIEVLSKAPQPAPEKRSLRHWRALECPQCGGAARKHLVTGERICSDCDYKREGR